MEPKFGDRIVRNSLVKETGKIVGVREREGGLPTVYYIDWDDAHLGQGVLLEGEFEVIGKGK